MGEGVDEMELRRRLEELFRAHAAAVHAYARRRTDPASADDAVGEVFGIAWRRIGDVPEPALPWLLACARRVLANQRRRERRVGALRSRLAANSPPLVSTDEGDGALRVVLDGLRGRDREILLLTAWEGLGPAEAAVVLGCSPRAAAVRLHRARRRLEAALAQVEADDPLTDAMEVVQ